MRARAEWEIEGETIRGRLSAMDGKYAETWARFGLRQLRQVIRHDFQCAAASTGQIRAFFSREPCKSMTRRLELLADGQGNLAAVSIAWVRMRTTGAAIRLQDLADTGKAGWVVPLSGELAGRPGIRFGEEYRWTRIRGSVVKFADAVRVAGNADVKVLDGLSDVGSEFPDPDP